MCPVIAADAAPATPAIPGSGILTQNVKFVRQSLGKFRPVRERIIFRGLGGFGIVDWESPGTRARDASTTVSLAALLLLTMTNIFKTHPFAFPVRVCLFGVEQLYTFGSLFIASHPESGLQSLCQRNIVKKSNFPETRKSLVSTVTAIK